LKNFPVKPIKCKVNLLEPRIFSVPTMAGDHVTILSSLGPKTISGPRMAGAKLLSVILGVENVSYPKDGW
jgi:hypothetical protein